jgi:hypothetical protein
MKKIPPALMAAVLGVALIFFLAGCESESEKEKEAENADQAPLRVAVVGGERVIKLTTKAGIVTALLNGESVQPEVKAYGTVLSMQDFPALQTRFAEARAEREKARARLKASRAEYERLNGLRQNNENSSAKALEAAEAAYRSDEADVRAADDRISAIEAECRAQWGEVIWSWLKGGEAGLARLVRGEDALVLITLPAGDTAAAPPRVSILDADGKRREATLVSPSPRVDSRFQQAGWFYSAPAAGKLLPGLNLTVFVSANGSVRGLKVPSAAVVWWQGKAWAYVEKAPGAYARREISAGRPAPGGWLIPSGIGADEPVVVKGAEQLLSEEFRSQIQAGEDED